MMAKKRMQLQLEEPTYALLRELSELSGMSASGLVTAMIERNRRKLEFIVRDLTEVAETPARVFDQLVFQLQNTTGRPVAARRAKGSLRGPQPSED